MAARGAGRAGAGGRRAGRQRRRRQRQESRQAAAAAPAAGEQAGSGGGAVATHPATPANLARRASPPVGACAVQERMVGAWAAAGLGTAAPATLLATGGA